MSVFVTYPCAGDSRGGRGRTTAEMRPRPRAGDGNLASDQGTGATPAGEALTEAGGADSDRGEWGGGKGEAGRRRRT